MTEKIIGQGAEAVLRKEGNILTKDRISKDYRIKEIDEKIRIYAEKERYLRLLTRIRL